MSKAMNLAQIVHRLLTSSKGWRTDSLRRELDIAPRTYRKYRLDLQTKFEPFLRENGVSAVEEVEEGEARYLRLVEMEETGFSTPDFISRVAAVQLARLLLDFLGETSIGESLEHLLGDFRTRLRDRSFVWESILRNVDRLFYQVPDAPKDYAQKSDELEALLHALIFNHVVEVEYDSASLSDAWTMRLCPYSLISYRSALYIAARHENYEDVRLYAVDRMLEVTETDEKFEYPSPHEFDPAEYTSGAFGLYRGDGDEKIEFELIFENQRWLKMFVREREWTADQKFEDLPDGRLRMTFTVSSDREVASWIRGFGDEVEVVKPPLL